MKSLEDKIQAFLANVGDGDAYAEYLKTGYKHMYFEDYFRLGDGLEELIEEQDEAVMEFIRENY